VLLGLTAAALTWYVLSLAGVVPLSYETGWTAHAAAGWAVFNTLFLLAAVARIKSVRYSADRRNGVRLRAGGRVLLDTEPAELIDLSVGGALVRCEHPPTARSDGRLRFSLTWKGQDIELEAIERSRVAVGVGGALLGLQFAPGQDREAGRLGVALHALNTATEQIRRRPAA
jgi:hypothetical protein